MERGLHLQPRRPLKLATRRKRRGPHRRAVRLGMSVALRARRAFPQARAMAKRARAQPAMGLLMRPSERRAAKPKPRVRRWKARLYPLRPSREMKAIGARAPLRARLRMRARQ